MRVIPVRDDPEFVIEYGHPEHPYYEANVVVQLYPPEFWNTKEGYDVILMLLFPSKATEV